MRPALKPPGFSLRGWIGRNPAIASGAFMSAVFVFVGLFGTVVFFPAFRDWRVSADWPTTEATITGSEVVYGSRSRGARPNFTFTYEWKGQAYTANGYDLIGAYFRGTSSGPHAVLAEHPVGSRVKVFVNPARPGQAVLVRAATGALVVLFVPPFFFLLGLVGTFFTVITALGWLNENTRNPLGRAVRTVGGWLLQEKLLKPFFFVVVGGVILGVGAWGVSEGNFLLVGLGAFMAWAVWRAARPRRGR